MQINQDPLQYIQQIRDQLTFISKNYLDQMSAENVEIYNKFDRVSRNIAQSFENQSLSEDVLFGSYGYFLQTIKKFKRKIENHLKLNQTDIECFKRKYNNMGVQLLPFIKDVYLPKERKINKFVYDEFLDVDFPHHIYTNKELCQFAQDIFEYLKVYDKFPLNRNTVFKLIIEMNLHYNVIPYHNWTHACQLFQLLFACYEKSTLKDFITELEFFSTLMAALAHDLNHKGVNNGYKIKKSQKTNILTSEQAVLENMHCAMFFNLIFMKKELDIFSGFQNPTEKEFIKRLIITSILATDMSKHKKLVDKFQKRVAHTIKHQELEAKNEEIDELTKYLYLSKENPEDRRFVINICVHACDISNPCMSFPYYNNWSYLLSQEFQDQTLKEAQNGLEVTGMLQFKGLQAYYGGQKFFINAIDYPLWKNIGNLFPELMYLPNQMENNLKEIEKVLQELQQN